MFLRAAFEPRARLLALPLAVLTSLAACSPTSDEPQKETVASSHDAIDTAAISAGPHLVQA
ncbi:MAG TPA: hypothetical protein VIG99_32140, partial [Myxococcaceae bacterium]